MTLEEYWAEWRLVQDAIYMAQAEYAALNVELEEVAVKSSHSIDVLESTALTAKMTGLIGRLNALQEENELYLKGYRYFVANLPAMTRHDLIFHLIATQGQEATAELLPEWVAADGGGESENEDLWN